MRTESCFNQKALPSKQSTGHERAFHDFWVVCKKCTCVPAPSACENPSFSLCMHVAATWVHLCPLSLSDKSLLRCLGDPRPRLTVTSFLADRKHILIKRGRQRRSRRKSIRTETSVGALAPGNLFHSAEPSLQCVCFTGGMVGKKWACETFTLVPSFL